MKTEVVFVRRRACHSGISTQIESSAFNQWRDGEASTAPDMGADRQTAARGFPNRYLGLNPEMGLAEGTRKSSVTLCTSRRAAVLLFDVHAHCKPCHRGKTAFP